MPDSEDHFYSNLPIHKMPLHQLLVKNQLFEKVISSWCVIITDIKRSTAAVNSGLHENVNLIATGSIVAVLNIAFKANISVPFFFGGDGATFIVPPGIVDDVMKSLLKYKENTLLNFNLDLRTGIIPVAEIYKNGHTLNICRFSSAETFSIPIVLGDGLAYAEQIIKGENYLLADHHTASDEIDLSGMQCRWDKIEPPENSDEVVTLVVIASEIAQQAAVFSKVILHLDQIYGSPEKRQPISVPKLIFRTSFNSLGKEMKHRLGKIKFLELIKSWFINVYGYIYFRTDRGKKYLRQLVEMSDTLVVDGRINTVITGTAKQRLALEQALNQLEKNNEILYAYYVSGESVMSCYVRDLEDDHIHFVDGADGGYTQAAGILKQKILDKFNALR
ncbi:DUF3095 domain-containing protein [Pedobacter alluvionis]|uniref:DUF3095 domain-containing protein n=1 Tax=Pedobacter alluvionis TaxID=475253 RepID=A0A497YKS6_9SPHI|nr:DUF3095 domain-containing protein [Pedobacter alluvionis]RLJ80670.1 Protein of unknown function (DUF3095) [Pedobacter alluvionis]TFB31924.1 DUF3095 domain-containing protein [Pedobacter alluvionis]